MNALATLTNYHLTGLDVNPKKNYILGGPCKWMDFLKVTYRSSGYSHGQWVRLLNSLIYTKPWTNNPGMASPVGGHTEQVVIDQEQADTRQSLVDLVQMLNRRMYCAPFLPALILMVTLFGFFQARRVPYNKT
jgi:hypothetical protein